jgi:Flp pilus assembly protein TadD
MAVLVEAISVIVRREAIARRYEGGWPGFVADGVNSTLCADSDIARIGFMHPDDVHAFVRRLEHHGFVFLDATGAAVDIVVVDQREGPTTPCAWIEFFRQDVPGGTVSAARLSGSQEKSLVCPNGWEFEHSLSHSVISIPGTKPNENIEFVGHEQDTDVFRDRQTGEIFYTTRPTALRGVDEEHPDADEEAIRREYNALWVEASDLLGPYLGPDNPPATAEEVAKVTRAREALERVTSLSNVSWRPWWLLGVARRLLRDREGAYAAFAHAYGTAPDEIEVGRNLGGECIALGYGQEAIAVTAAMVRLAPDNAGLIGNHALALLIGGDLDGALREVQRAGRLDPDDEVTLNLRNLIDDVRAGRVQAPSRIDT